MGEERRPLWPWIVVLMVGLPMLYALLLGPACWISSHSGCGSEIVSAIYEPLIFESPGFIRPVLHHYSQLGAVKGWHWRRISGGWSNLHLGMQ